MSGLNKKIWILVGTRPEVIKQVPVYEACVRRFGLENVAFVGTGQHRELLVQALDYFGHKLDENFDLMTPTQTLPGISAKVLERVGKAFEQDKPEWIVVQGDTTSAAMAAWAAFQSGVKVLHNEAGLRSYDLQHPYPEEANRRLISVVAQVHCVPTAKAKQALLSEGTRSDQIHITGNPGIDALRMALERKPSRELETLRAKVPTERLVLMTAHRRENRGDAVDQWFRGLREFLDAREDLSLIYPMHPNEMAREAFKKHLESSDRAILATPLPYGDTVHLLKSASWVVTDSGGIQEEATTLGMPVVVCRKTTERMEAVESGWSRLAGTETSGIMDAMAWADQRARELGGKKSWLPIFGDGHAADRIAALVSINSSV